MQHTKILVVEDDAGLREALVDTLSLAQYQVIAADSAEQAMQLLKQHKIRLVISDVQMGGMSGLELLKSIKLNYNNIPVLMMTAYATVNDAVQAIRLGAVDYLAKPFSPQVLVNMVSRYVPLDEVAAFEPIVAAPVSQQLVKLAAKVARSDASVMVLGPSGSGKEVLARYIHQQSPRHEGPFIAINCAAIPENMLESTLFGYEKGAFTGAIQACPGKFEQAQHGTILLDEISEMDLNLQAKLLRVLQEREVERLGSRKTIKLDVRVIATSNRDLRQTVQQGLFREDLFYRLNVFPLTWPALADRMEDILPLCRHLLERHCQQQGEAVPNLTAAAQRKLLQHDWPGNVRELDNVMQRALIVHTAPDITAEDILLELGAGASDWQDDEPAAATLDPDLSLFKSEVYEQEHRIILETMRACANRRKDVAEKLGISARTLRYKLARMRESGIQLPA
ncbi:MAG: sigma-54-dependent transcriptional regulator [Rheinheimera sp.]